MSNEKILFDADVNTGNSAQNIKSVRAELRELQQQMAGLEPSSREFIRAAQRAGELQDRMRDVKASVDAFNPEQKFQAFAGVIGGVANGISVAQGAMQLMGDDTKEVEKAMQKTQAAIAIATGVNGLLGMKDAFVVLSNVIKTQVVTSFNTLGKAIRSTGIIALVASLGVLIYEWYKTKQAAKEAADQLQEFSEAYKDLEVEGMRGRQRDTTNVRREMNKQLQEIDKKIKEEKISIEQGEVLKKLIRENARKELKDVDAKWDKIEKDEADKKRKERQDAELKRADDLISLRKAKGLETFNAVDQLFALEFQKLKYQKDQKLITENEFQAKILELERQNSEARKKISDEELAAKLSAMQTASQALIQFSQLAGEQTAAGKALAIASTTIDTYVSAVKAYKAALDLPVGGAFLAPIAAAGAIASGLASVRRIAAVQVPNSNLGGGGGIPGGSIPTAPRIPQNVQGISLMGANQPLLTRNVVQEGNRVFVLESDITNVQERVREIKQKAKIK